MGKAPLLEHGKMKKKPRGIYCYAKDAESDIELVRWHNNSIVTVASNCLRLMPFAPANRWSYQKKSIVVSQPNMVTLYKKFKEEWFA